jgi:hypothetical protein
MDPVTERDPEVSAMIEVLEDMPEGVVGVEAVGEVTASDYETVLIPTFETGRAAHDHLNVVFVAGERFTGFTSGAMWDDVKWGTTHAKGWGRVALVTDVDWMRHATSVFGWMTPGDVKTFTLAERDAAIKWAATP